MRSFRSSELSLPIIDEDKVWHDGAIHYSDSPSVFEKIISIFIPSDEEIARCREQENNGYESPLFLPVECYY